MATNFFGPNFRSVKGFPIQIDARPFMRDADLLSKSTFVMAARLGDMTEPLTLSVRKVIIPSMEYNFFAQGRPKWAELSPEWKEYKLSLPISMNYLTLLFTHKLVTTVMGKVYWRITKTSADMEALDGRVPYAKYHQSGTRTMPQRQFAILQLQDIENIAVIFDDWIRRTIYSRDFWPYTHKEF